MQDYLNLFYFITLSGIGAWFHFYKKRYIEEILTISYKDYLLIDKKSTFKALTAIVSSSYVFAIEIDNLFALTAIANALTTGYTADSLLNKSQE